MTWLWTQRCNLTGETNAVVLTDGEKLQIEKQPGFQGWEPGEIVAIED